MEKPLVAAIPRARVNGKKQKENLPWQFILPQFAAIQKAYNLITRNSTFERFIRLHGELIGARTGFKPVLLPSFKI